MADIVRVGVVLAIVFAAGMFGIGAFGSAVGIAGLVCGLLLLQLPAVAWRMAGGSRRQMLAVAVGVPLFVIEIWLGISGAESEGRGGDLQGVEYILMWVVIAPIVLSAVIVTLVTDRLVSIDPPAD
ncbi:MAG: hypothetical protein E7773_13785 [Sphingomonas sp.]|uniref:hypothetical protein n=1 Tax=Sphingomonas sp. TaxID=28214 RepID=UPI00121D7E9F|nr:hypothetical protein [Sphingomonas sp.]THD34733.1 MAG: hypothetical protein E7773_13785 [Sphingomonas sp.]